MAADHNLLAHLGDLEIQPRLAKRAITTGSMQQGIHFHPNVMDSDDKESFMDGPASPLTDLVNRHLLQQPSVAVVHQCNLPERGGSKDTSQAGSRAGSKQSVGRRLHRAVTTSNAAMAFGGRPPSNQAKERAGSKDERRDSVMSAGSAAPGEAGVRELTEEEAARKRNNAVDWFHQAQTANERIQGQSMEERMATYRQRRAASKTGNLSPRGDSKDRSLSRAGSKEVERAGAKGGARRSPSKDSGISPTGMSATSLAGKEIAGESSAPQDKPQPAKRSISLLEKFGYGIAPKKTESKENIDSSAFTKKKQVMCEVKAGNNDLLERLRQDRRARTVS